MDRFPDRFQLHPRAEPTGAEIVADPRDPKGSENASLIGGMRDRARGCSIEETPAIGSGVPVPTRPQTSTMVERASQAPGHAAAVKRR